MTDSRSTKCVDEQDQSSSISAHMYGGTLYEPKHVSA